ncbi:unnamed protein product [Arabidopsis lyrata]|nr:unnamed protein product [Arabidopsis lyrata]
MSLYPKTVVREFTQKSSGSILWRSLSSSGSPIMSPYLLLPFDVDESVLQLNLRRSRSILCCSFSSGIPQKKVEILKNVFGSGIQQKLFGEKLENSLGSLFKNWILDLFQRFPVLIKLNHKLFYKGEARVLSKAESASDSAKQLGAFMAFLLMMFIQSFFEKKLDEHEEKKRQVIMSKVDERLANLELKQGDLQNDVVALRNDVFVVKYTHIIASSLPLNELPNQVLKDFLDQEVKRYL